MTPRYNTDMILPVYQPLGSSSHQLAATIGEERGEKATHTGTLDPMAEGVLIVLTGEDRFQKSAYAKWPKVYRFSIVWGVQTDTDDSLGILQTMVLDQPPPTLEGKIKKTISAFLGTQHQTLHPFSARRWQGKSSFDWATAQQTIPIKTREITVDQLTIINQDTLSLTDMQTEFEQRLELVRDGNWRQGEIRASWQKVWDQPTQTLPRTWFELHCSHGTYVRQLARDLTREVGFPGMVWNLIRTQNGEYTKNNTKRTYS